jgi:biopolymer transport protein ExbB/TolQ
MTLIFLINIALAVRAFIFINNDRFDNSAAAMRAVDTIKYLGVIVLTLGILGQVIGLYEAFKVIEQMGEEISANLLAGGLKVSSVTTLLGLSYFVLSYASWVFIRSRISVS